MFGAGPKGELVFRSVAHFMQPAMESSMTGMCVCHSLTLHACKFAAVPFAWLTWVQDEPTHATTCHTSGFKQSQGVAAALSLLSRGHVCLHARGTQQQLPCHRLLPNLVNELGEGLAGKMEMGLAKVGGGAVFRISCSRLVAVRGSNPPPLFNTTAVKH